jgi:phosphoribosylglycinamide formyltransferase
MDVAAVASSGTGLRCSLYPAPNPQRRSARVGFTTKCHPCAATCRRLLLRLNARLYTAASASASPVTDSSAGYSGVGRKRLAVFVSGGGSNFRSIHEAALGGKVNGDMVVLVTDKPGDDICLPPKLF